jgi:hypothetical protein
MAGEFEAAGEDLIRSLKAALVGEAEEIMRESIIECPVSGPETYIAEFGTQYRQIEGRPVFLGNEDDEYIAGDAGTLRRSARVFAPRSDGNEITVEMGYGFGEEINPAGRLAAEYAVPVHERGDLDHEPPTKAYYLLDPLLRHAGTFERDLAIRMEETHPAELPHGEIVADGVDLGAEPA